MRIEHVLVSACNELRSGAGGPLGCPTSASGTSPATTAYGALHDLARNRVNAKLILTHWDDILRVIASLSTGTVRASELLRVLQGGGRPTPLGRAIAELGRAAKTLHLGVCLRPLSDQTSRPSTAEDHTTGAAPCRTGVLSAIKLSGALVDLCWGVTVCQAQQ
ncbi:hypothetical protein BH20ACT16_BH20ACT16_01760 [soil metagenome]|jgi:hypothetical protein